MASNLYSFTTGNAGHPGFMLLDVYVAETLIISEEPDGCSSFGLPILDVL